MKVITFLFFLLLHAGSVTAQQSIAVKEYPYSDLETGRILFYKGEYNKSINTLRRSTQKISNKADLSKLYNTIGSAYLLKGDFDSATFYFYLAAEGLDDDRNNSLLLAKVYNNLSVTFLSLGERDKALKYTLKAESIVTENHHKAYAIVTLINKGKLYKEERKWDTAINNLKEAIRLCKQISNKLSVDETSFSPDELKQSALLYLGEVYCDKGVFDTALSYLNKAMEMNAFQNPYYSTSLHLLIGQTYLKLQHLHLAEKHLYQTLSLAKEIRSESLEVLAYYELSMLHEAKNNYKEAYQNRLKFEEIDKRLSEKEKIKNINLLEIRYRTAQKDKEIVEKKLVVNQQQNALRKKDIWIVTASFSTLILFILLVVSIRTYRHKQFLQRQQILVIQNEKRIELLKATMEGEENERNRLADILHDGIGSIISAVKMNFSTLKIEPSDKYVYDNIIVLLNDAANELRTTAHNLMPRFLFQDGLKLAIISFCERISNASFNIEHQFYGDFDHFDKNFELFVYRIIQELINNVIKHASATYVLIQLSAQHDLFTITIEDNGVGFRDNLDDINFNNGKGLENLREKIALLNGHFSIESKKISRTHIYIEFDIQNFKNKF